MIPVAVAGSAVGGAASMALDVSMPAPPWGIVVVLSNKPLAFLGCLVLGTVVTAVLATLVKPDFDVTVADIERAETAETPGSPSD